MPLMQEMEEEILVRDARMNDQLTMSNSCLLRIPSAPPIPSSGSSYVGFSPTSVRFAKSVPSDLPGDNLSMSLHRIRYRLCLTTQVIYRKTSELLCEAKRGIE